MFIFYDMDFQANTAICLIDLLTQSFDVYDRWKSFEILYQQNFICNL